MGIGDYAERNTISGNLEEGIRIRGAGTDHTVVAGNFIGTDATGMLPLGNGDPTHPQGHIGKGVIVINPAPSGLASEPMATERQTRQSVTSFRRIEARVWKSGHPIITS